MNTCIEKYNEGREYWEIDYEVNDPQMDSGTADAPCGVLSYMDDGWDANQDDPEAIADGEIWRELIRTHDGTADNVPYDCNPCGDGPCR